MEQRSSEQHPVIILELEEILNILNTKTIEQISEQYQDCDSSITNDAGKNNLKENEIGVQEPVNDLALFRKKNEHMEFNLNPFFHLTTKEHMEFDLNPFFHLTTKEFTSREELLDGVRNIAQKQGFVAVMNKSRTDSYVNVGCDRGGTYRRAHIPMDQRKRSTGSRLINCPFQICGRKKGIGWRIEIKELSHNHEPSFDLSGHPMCRRLSEEEMQNVRNMSKAGSAPREILTALQQNNPDIKAISRTIYNARAMVKHEDLRGRTVIEALLEELAEGGFFYDIERDKDDRLTHLFFSHPSSMILIKNFSNVFVMDCTYKTNKYKMPLLDIVGITSFNTSFFSSFVFLQKEEEKDYIWALERFKKLLGEENNPKVIITDRELALMNAIDVVFPQTTHLLCVWHIEKNILAKCKKYFDEQEDFKQFISAWTNAIYCVDEPTFDDGWNHFKVNYLDKSSALDYIEKTWLPYKERFVYAWTENHFHIGNHVTSRAEGAHAMLKKYHQVSTCNLHVVKEKLRLAIENQFQEVKAMLQIEKIRIPHNFHIPLFQKLLGKVSKHALDKLLQQYELVASGKPLGRCRGHLQNTMGLPCAHKISRLLTEKLELVDIHLQWRIDGRSFENSEGEQNFKDGHIDCILKEFKNKYEKMPLGLREEARRKVSQIAETSVPIMIQEPKIHQGKGRAAGLRKRKSVTSTKRDPSGFEIVERTRKCGKCKGPGHDIRTCREYFENNVINSASSTYSEEEYIGSANAFDSSTDLF